MSNTICTDQSQLKLEHISGVFPWDCLGTVRTALWRALPCPATNKMILNYLWCQLYHARWSGIFLFRFQINPAKMARSHQLYVTHHETMSLCSGSFEGLLSRERVTVTFLTDLGGEDQSSLTCGTGTLPLLDDLFPQCLGVHRYLQPW